MVMNDMIGTVRMGDLVVWHGKQVSAIRHTTMNAKSLAKAKNTISVDMRRNGICRIVMFSSQ